MRDFASIERANKLHPNIRQEAVECIETAESGFPENIRIRIAQGLRTFAEQDALCAKRPRVTKAKGGQSLHNYGLAIDFVLLYDKDNNGTFEEVSWDIAKDFDNDGIADWNEVVKQFESKGWEWGGKWRTFKDYPHVQKTVFNGKNYRWQDLLTLYNSGKVDNNGYVLI